MVDENESLILELANKLEIDLSVIACLVENQITSIEEIAHIPEEELLSVKSLDKELLLQLRIKAKNYLTMQAIQKTSNED